MRNCVRLLAPAVFAALVLPTAIAGTASGTITNHNDVVRIPITILDTTDLTIWTDSFGTGGFDPVLSLWSGGSLLMDNDDSLSVAPVQSFMDSVLRLQGVAPGEYILTVTTYDNFANSLALSDGFRHDGSAPVPIEEWWTMGAGNYNVKWVPQYLPFINDLPAIPEPSSWAMLLAGLGVAGIALRRRTRTALRRAE